MGRRAKVPNEQLAELLAEAGCSRRRLACYVVELGRARGVAGLRYDHTSVLRWLAGEQPRAPVPDLIAEVISGLAGRVVTPADLGMRAGEIRPGLGTELPVTWEGGVREITGLWRADVERREFVTGAAFGVAAYASAGMRWLTLPAPVLGPAEAGAGRRIGAEEIGGLREITRTYRQLDNRLGGGQLRATVVALLDRQVTPLLTEAAYSQDTGRQLAEVAAELAQLAGWMAYDSEQHGLAQRYLIQALGLARLAADDAMAAEILAAMSQQAVYVARPGQAIDLARVAQAAARKSGSAVLLAECHVAEAHGHAARDDAQACAAALGQADRAFGQARPGSEPAWLAYFDEAYLAARMAHCFRDLGQAPQAARFARRSLDMNQAYVRGRAFNLALLGTALAQQGQAEEAAAVGLTALDVAAGLRSRRSTRYLQDLRRRLAPTPPHRRCGTSVTGFPGCQQHVLHPDDRGCAGNLARGDQAADLGQRDPADRLGLVRIRRPYLVRAAGQVQLVRAVGGPGQRLERQHVLDAAGPVPGLLLHLPRGRDRAVLAGIDVAAGQLPHPPVQDEPVPPDQQHPLGGLIQHHRHRDPRHPRHILLEPGPVRQLHRRHAQPDMPVLIHNAVGVDDPAGAFLVLGHGWRLLARAAAARCPGAADRIFLLGRPEPPKAGVGQQRRGCLLSNGSVTSRRGAARNVSAHRYRSGEPA